MEQELDGTEVPPPPKDEFIEHWFQLLGFLAKGVPDAYRIWAMGQGFLAAGDPVSAKKCETLNYILHNSVVPNEARLGKAVRFGYGGIGVVIHAHSEIGDMAVLEAGVVLGGGNAGRMRINAAGKRVGAPKVENYAYLSVGAKVLGGVTVGSLSVVGANAVVRDNIPPLSVAVGSPAKVVKRIDLTNYPRYRMMFTPLREMPEEEFRQVVVDLLERKAADEQAERRQ
jgi:serine O-acetyltransferase